MQPEHHYKLIFISGTLVFVIVAILGIIFITGNRNSAPQQLPAPQLIEENQEQSLIDATSAPASSTQADLTDPEILKLIEATSAPNDSTAPTASEREALIRATSGN